MNIPSRSSLLLAAFLVAPAVTAAFPGITAAPTHRVEDRVYLQETGRQFPTGTPLTAVATQGGVVFVGGPGGLLRLDAIRGELMPEPAWNGPVTRLVTAGDRLWALGPSGLHQWQTNGWSRVTTNTVTDVAAYRGGWVAASGNTVFQIRDDGLSPITTNTAPFTIAHLEVHQLNLWIHGEGRISYLDRGRFGGLDSYGFPSDHAVDWGRLPSPQTRDFLSVGGALWFATPRGLGELRGMRLRPVTGADGLPFEDATCLAEGFAGDLWVGTTHGAIRCVDGAHHYFAGRRWLPGEHVHAIATAGRSVWLATDRGLAEIRYEPFTLAKKAAWYEAHLDAWGQKRLGFTHKLEWDAPLGEYVREVSDNDGGYSGDYLAAQAYRWAVTRDPVARREATNTFHAIRWLESMTGLPGFPARAVWAKGERGHKAGHGSGGYAAEWNDVEGGLFEWKGDTSSDEIASQFYAVTLFLELAAEGAEIEQGKRHLTRIADHLLRNGWKLVDHDGKPTRWGHWDPEYFATEEGRFDRGLQALELLSFMKTAWHFTREPRFDDAYRRLIQLGYPDFTLRQRSSFPPEDIAHFEDQLAFWAWWNLLRFETDPDLLALYRRGYERSYDMVRIERNPWYQFVYGALTGQDCETGEAVKHLREWPLDLRVWSFANSHRTDLRTPPGLHAPKGGIRAFSPREHQPMRWDAWTMQEDGGTGGNDVAEPGGWLVAYWMGRYHGYITAPIDAPAEATTVRPGEAPAGGARPYAGPPRPPVP